MRVAFLYPETDALGIQYLSAVLKQGGHQTRLVFDPVLFNDTTSPCSFLAGIFDSTDRVVSEVKDYAPDLVAFSVMTPYYNWACRLASRIKQETSAKTVFGGIHATTCPEEVFKNDCVDFMIRGEGEFALLELADSKFDPRSFSDIGNLAYKRGGKEVYNPLRPILSDLDSLPFPDKDLFFDISPRFDTSGRYSLMTGRGCPHVCTFCSNAFVNRLYGGNYMRRRSPGNVIKELVWAKERYGVKYAIFDDSTFTYDTAWLKEFTPLYKREVGLPSFCWVYPTDVDEEMVGFLKTMNCGAVQMGVESLDPVVRRNLLHRYYDNAAVIKALALFKDSGIFTMVDNIKGLGTDRVAEMTDMISFYNHNRPGKVYLFEFRELPKTEIIKMRRPDPAAMTEPTVPFTVVTRDTTMKVKQLEFLLVLSSFLPPRIVDFMLNKKIYRLLPPVAAYGILDVLPYLLIKFKFQKGWMPARGFRGRYFTFARQIPRYLWRRVRKTWASK